MKFEDNVAVMRSMGTRFVTYPYRGESPDQKSRVRELLDGPPGSLEAEWNAWRALAREIIPTIPSDAYCSNGRQQVITTSSLVGLPVTLKQPTITLSSLTLPPGKSAVDAFKDATVVVKGADGSILYEGSAGFLSSQEYPLYSDDDDEDDDDDWDDDDGDDEE